MVDDTVGSVAAGAVIAALSGFTVLILSILTGHALTVMVIVVAVAVGLVLGVCAFWADSWSQSRLERRRRRYDEREQRRLEAWERMPSPRPNLSVPAFSG